MFQPCMFGTRWQPVDILCPLAGSQTTGGQLANVTQIIENALTVSFDQVPAATTTAAPVSDEEDRHTFVDDDDDDHHRSVDDDDGHRFVDDDDGHRFVDDDDGHRFVDDDDRHQSSADDDGHHRPHANEDDRPEVVDGDSAHGDRRDVNSSVTSQTDLPANVRAPGDTVTPRPIT